jgi:integrase
MAGRPRGTSRDLYIVSRKEYEDLLAHIKGQGTKTSVRNYIIVLILYWIGLSTKDIFGLLISELYQDNGEPKTRWNIRKGREERYVIIERDTLLWQKLSFFYEYSQECQGDRFDPDSPMFISGKGKATSAHINRMVIKAFTEIGLNGYTADSLRYSCACRYYDNGKDFEFIANQLGDKNWYRVRKKVLLIQKKFSNRQD